MGANCCSTRTPDPNEDSNGLGMRIGGSVTPMDDSKFREDLLDKFKFHRLDFSTFGGQSEAAILVERETNRKSRPKLIQRYSVNANNLIVN